jgi:hypothetical protein
MNEQEWLRSDTHEMLGFLRSKVSDRKLRLFACACCRRIWHLTSDERGWRAVEAAEKYADGQVSEEEMGKWSEAAWLSFDEHLPYLQTRVFNLAANNAAEVIYSLALPRIVRRPFWRAARSTAGHVLMAAIWNTCDGQTDDKAIGPAESAAQASLLRHIVGNPFRPYSAPPSWPANVVQLAEAVYQGGDTGFALADALLEAGRPELAQHFRSEQAHPKGCWVVDMVLGKT